MSREVNLGQIVPNIQVGATRTITPKESANVINVGTSLNPIFDFYIPKGDPGVINLLIVNELPLVGSEDTLYFVLKEDTEESDLYDEYVWINNDWELVGEKQITVDLSDYYTKQEVNSLIPTQLSELSEDSTHRVVADVEKTTWNNKLEQSDLVNYVKNTDYATTNKGGIIKISNTNATGLGTAGNLLALKKTYSEYTSATDYMFVGKGTLENVITGKELVNKTYVDDLAGDIPTSLADLSDDSTHRTVTDAEKSTWNNKSNFSGNYNDLTNKPTIPTVPTNVSAFTNDAGYLTQHQDISGKLDTSKVKTTSSTTAGDVYDVRYINTMLGDIETLLGGI